MGNLLIVFRLILGGGLCGCLLGTPVGAVIGTSLGFLLANNASLGLDGALIGGSLLGLAGALYGFALSLVPTRAAEEMPPKEELREMTTSRH